MRYFEINERFAPPVNWQWTGRSESEWVAIFTIGLVTYTVSLVPYDRQADAWELAFTAATEGTEFGFSTSGTGKAFTVFGTVIAIARSFIEARHPQRLMIESDLDTDGRPERSRHAVNRRLASAIAQDMRYTVTDASADTLLLVRDKVPALESVDPGFQRWFGNSKVVDAEGQPLVVYHGTNQTFKTFSKKRGGMSTGSGAGASHGFFFTNDYGEAEDYAQSAGRKVVANVGTHEKQSERLRKASERLEQIAQRSGRQADWTAYEQAYAAWEQYETDAIQEDPMKNVQVISAYLSLQNPLEAHFDEDGLHSEYGVIEDVINKARRDGHDGVIMRNISDSPSGGRARSDQYVAFSAKQIRRV